MRKYFVTAAAEETAGKIAIHEVGVYDDFDAAIEAAKNAAETQADCYKYGPSSLAWFGEKTTAVIAWK